ncbi:UDENN domain-containing protein [Entamoeba marina]
MSLNSNYFTNSPSSVLSPTSLRQSFFSVKTLTVSTLHEHWGVIWGSFESLISQCTQRDLLKTTLWKTPRYLQIPNTSQKNSHVFLFDIISYPDIQSKQLNMTFVNDDKVSTEIQTKVKGYGFNQYFKSIPFKSSIHIDKPNDMRIQTTHIPTYYQYSFGNFCMNNIIYEKIVFTVHVPLMMKSDTGYPVIVIDIGIDLPDEISNDMTFHNSLYDSINQIMFYYQLNNLSTSPEDAIGFLQSKLNHFIENLEEFITSVEIPHEISSLKPFQTKQSLVEKCRFVSSIISAHVRSYYTICIPDSIDTINTLSILLGSFSNKEKKLYNSHQITPHINPFYSIQYVANIDPSEYFAFPFPISLIKMEQLTAEAMKEVDTPLYFSARTGYFLNIANKTLKLPGGSSSTNPLAYMMTIDHITAFEDFLLNVISLVEQNQYNSAEFMLQQMSIQLLAKATMLYKFIIQRPTPFTRKLVDEMQICSNTQKDELEFLICLLKNKNPLMVSKLLRCLYVAKHQDNQITKNFF